MRRGFTLIELMIVISVMAILMGIALPYFKGMQDEGNSAKAAGELRTLVTAIESFNIHSSSGYPELTDGGIVSAWQTTTDVSLTDATPTIVKIALMDAFATGEEYKYGTSPNLTDGSALYYVVFSVGPDGSAGISGIEADGALTGVSGSDDIYISNGVAGNSF